MPLNKICMSGQVLINEENSISCDPVPAPLSAPGPMRFFPSLKCTLRKKKKKKKKIVTFANAPERTAVIV